MKRLLVLPLCVLVALWTIQLASSPAWANGPDSSLKADKQPQKSKDGGAKRAAKKDKDKQDAAGQKPAAKDSQTAPEKKPAAKEAEGKKDPAKKDASPKGEGPKASAEAKKEPAADKPKTDQAKTDAKPATYTVKKRPIRVEVALDGIFEASHTAEIALRVQEWNEFEVLKAVEHGAQVRKGDVLVSIDTERIDRAIVELQRDQQLSAIAIHETEMQLQAARALQPLDAAALDRGHRISQEDQERFFKIDRPMSERIVNFMVKVAEDNLAYQEEELRQLEKMYKADDLTEETEEIILRRSRDTVERARFNLERMKIERDEILKQSLPRAEEAVRLSTQRQTIEYQRGKIVLPLGPRRLELTLERLKHEAARGAQRLTRLQEDRAAMTIKAPLDGNVYYGRCVRGKWSGTETAAEKLRRGGRLANNDVFLTVVESRPLSVRVAVPEKQLRHITAGLKGFVQPSSLADVKLEAIVQRVATVPSATREFDTVLTVALDNAAKTVMPGMSCEAKFVPYFKPDALAVPAAAVGSDDLDPRKQYVALPGKDGKPQKKAVTLGQRADKYVEVLTGLAEGNEILAEYPKEFPSVDKDTKSK